MVSDTCSTFTVPSELDRELQRFADEFRSQSPPIVDEQVADEGSLACRLWRERGLPDDPSRAEAVRAFLTSVKEQTRPGSTGLPELDRLTRTGSVMGSPQYMAPEQASGNLDQIGRQTDVYGLGATFYELLTGRPPFQGASLFGLVQEVMARPPIPPGQLEPSVPAGLEAVCLRCLEKEPRKRYPTAAALAEDLAAGAPAGGGQANDPAAGQKSLAAVQQGTRSWWPFRRRSD
jgi:serine/threonine protein kinase